ncbi:MAG TPA: DoxX family protein [Chryseosolibacter sp.]
MTVIDTPVVKPEKVLGTPRKNEPATELQESGWNRYEKIVFRFFFIYFVLLAVPLDWNYYGDLFSRDWSSLHVSNLFYAARYTPKFFSDVPVFLDWAVIAAIALAGTFVWGVIEPERKEYNTLYYWLRVLIRYRLAAALLAYGFIKFFPQQMPWPSISNLNTNYGDLADWKVFSMSTGIVPGYQSFLGLVEITAALLLLNRKTALVGAFIVLPFTGNVVLSNLAYEGGEYVYGTLLVSFALFLVTYDVVRLYRFGAELNTLPNRYKLTLKEAWQRNSRIAAKLAFIFIFVVLYGYQSYASYKQGGYQYQTTAGIPGTEGLYNVKEFSVNGEVIPPSRTHSARWRDVVFEKWATLSIRSNEPVTLHSALTEEIRTDDAARDYEFSGNGGRHFYSYTYDEKEKTLTAVNRADVTDTFQLRFERLSPNTIQLSGRNNEKDFVNIVLEKVDKKYLLEEAAKNGRRRGLKL